MNIKLIYTTPEAEVILIRPTFSVLQGSPTGGTGDNMDQEQGGWGN